MENASRALIIAGAILIGIVLISTAMLMVNSMTETADQSSYMEATNITVFNKKFYAYYSDSASASTAKNLVNKILQNNTLANSPNTFSPDAHQILLNYYPKNKASITHKWKTDDLKNIYNKISSTSKYNIYTTKCTTYPNGYYNGYLICISIKEL